MMEPDSQLRNLRDFLLVYNRMTEICFQRCSSNFNYRNLTMDEERCVDNCAGKLIRSNHRLMATYVQLMPRMVQRRMEEMESKAAENAKAEAAAAAAAASASVGPPVAESPQVTPLVTTSVTDIGAGQSSLELNTAQVGMSAVTTLTPAPETVNSFNVVDSGISFTAGFPQTPTTGAQNESIGVEAASVQPVFTPLNATSLSKDVPVTTTSAPSVSSQNQSGPE